MPRRLMAWPSRLFRTFGNKMLALGQIQAADPVLEDAIAALET
ncbi:hypothetical protein SAMN02927923_04477 [Microvirga guangxiensis]|uniref:Uncharacterized protein n=1 Tax=Microvirga guangxiensis TaxID=549386 RepID=A0A1G5LN98_9HYPH|nr:hypothetical protein SAMN02927923_04477 [Microvirga guangxiensis]